MAAIETPVIVAICQPNFAPWIGYFEMIDRVDVFIYLDDVQFSRKEWVNRNKIRSAKPQGWEWISVAVRHEGQIHQTISETLLSHRPPWIESVIAKIQRTYDKFPYYGELSGAFFEILKEEQLSLVDLNIRIITWALQVLGISTQMVKSSSLCVDGVKDTKLIGLVKKVGGTFYLANNGSKSYIQPQLFLSQGLGFAFQDYNHPNYNGYSLDVLPPLSFLDLLFSAGPIEALSILRKGRSQAWGLEKSMTLRHKLI